MTVSDHNDHIRAALRFRSVRLRQLLGDVLDAAEEIWDPNRSNYEGLKDSQNGSLAMNASLAALDAALAPDEPS